MDANDGHKRNHRQKAKTKTGAEETGPRSTHTKTTVQQSGGPSQEEVWTPYVPITYLS